MKNHNIKNIKTVLNPSKLENELKVWKHGKRL